VITLPEGEQSLLLFSAKVGGTIRAWHGNEIARNYYLEAKWCKSWPDLVQLVRGWVTLNEPDA
jgi:hypothetical protein